jgi:predicted aspartyl protease
MRDLTAALILLSAIILPGLALGDVYYWVDEKGVQNYTTRLENIPEPYRPSAESLSLPAPPAAPPELQSGSSQKGFTRIPFVPGSPILISAKINGAGLVTLILDTGADRTVVSPPVLSKLGVSNEGGYRGLIKGVTGMSYADAVWVTSIEVGEAKAGPFLVIVHDAGLKGADGLLGRDFLANFNVTIDPKEGIVTLMAN